MALLRMLLRALLLQVLAMQAAVGTLLQQHRLASVVDIGAGRGYLSHALASSAPVRCGSVPLPISATSAHVMVLIFLGVISMLVGFVSFVSVIFAESACMLCVISSRDRP